MAKPTIGAKIALDGEKEFKNAISSINKDMSVLTSEMKKVTAEFADNGNSTDALTAKQDVLNKKIDTQKEKIETLRNALKNSAKTYGENANKTKDWQIKLNNAEAELSKLNNQLGDNKSALNDMSGATDEISEGFDDIGDSAKNAGDSTGMFAEVLKANLLSDAIMSGIRLIVDSVKSMADATVGFAMDSQTALNDLQTQTGATDEEMSALKDTMNSIYADNFGDDINDVADSMALVEQQTKLSGDALKDATEQALLMRDTFDFDVSESVRAADMLMTQFGLTSEESYNLIAQGAQNGLNKNGDLLDIINEYSVQFKQTGLGAEDMFNIFESGAENGTFSFDLLSDAVKELGISIRDGSGADALTELGLNADEITKKFGEGGEAARDAMEQVTTALYSVSDPIEQNNIGVQLFATKWEDLGTTGIQALTNLQGSISTTSTALQDINNTKYNDIGSALEGLGRQIQVKITDNIGENVLPMVQELIGYVQTNGPAIAETVGNIANKVGDLVKWIVDNGETVISIIAGIATGLLAWNVVSTITSLIEVMKGLKVATEATAAAQKLLNIAQAASPIGIIITLVAGLVAGIIALWTTNEDFRDAVKKIWKDISDTISGAIDSIMGFFDGVIDFFKKNWQGLLLFLVNPFLGGFKLLYDNNETFRKSVNKLATDVIKYFGDMGAGIKSKVKLIKDTIKKGFKDAIDWILYLPKQAFGWGVDMIIGIAKGIRAAIKYVHDAVEDVAEEIKKYIHFSVPDEGPLTEYESWMPDMMEGLAKGIDKNKGIITKSLKSLTSNMKNELSGINLAESIPTNFDGNLKLNGLVTRSDQTVIYITVPEQKINGNKIAEAVTSKVTTNITRGQTNKLRALGSSI